jgi:hypothetical protein
MAAVSLIACQAAAAFVSYRMARSFWHLRLRQDHIDKIDYYQCTSLMQVIVIYYLFIN